MSDYVHRNKYEKAKNAAITWHHMFEKYKKESEEKIKFLDSEILKLRNNNKNNSETEDKYKDKITLLERDKILQEGKIQQLESSLKDLRERYNELKQDYRELNGKK